MGKAFLGLGSNMGNKQGNLNKALILIEESIGRIIASSSVYNTEPWGFKSKEIFLNMVICVESSLTPSGLLGRILMIESRLGRLRNDQQFVSRIIDIDILLYDNLVMNAESLIIPHPRMTERRFVLVPLCEIAPEVIHPLFNKTILSLLEECKDSSRVTGSKEK
jgi:deoxyguanosine kinase